MRRSIALTAAAFTCGAALAACYTSTSNPVAPAKPTPTSSVKPSPTPTQTGSPRPTPTPTPTTRPTGPTPTPTPIPTGPTPTPTATATAQPQVVHIGFELLENTDPTFGPVWYYSATPGNQANVVHVVHGSQLVFLNDGSNPSSPHTAAGFGSTGFPPSFDNKNRFVQFGSVIDSSLTWSTGQLNPGQMSQVFTVGPPGNYFFGCGFHYSTPPTKTNQSMGDVIVSQ
jgi:hypothetical protein